MTFHQNELLGSPLSFNSLPLTSTEWPSFEFTVTELILVVHRITEFMFIRLERGHFRGVFFTLHLGHLPNTFCFISPSICCVFPTNLIHLPNKLLRFPNKLICFPNKMLHFPNQILISPMQCCVTLPKNNIIKIHTSAHQNPDICSLHFGKLTVVMWRWWC